MIQLFDNPNSLIAIAFLAAILCLLSSNVMLCFVSLIAQGIMLSIYYKKISISSENMGICLFLTLLTFIFAVCAYYFESCSKRAWQKIPKTYIPISLAIIIFTYSNRDNLSSSLIIVNLNKITTNQNDLLTIIGILFCIIVLCVCSILILNDKKRKS